MQQSEEYILEIIESVKTAMPFRIQCYGFALILKSVFPNAVIFYNSNHCITKIGKDYYDIDGKVKLEAGHRFRNLEVEYGERIKEVLLEAKKGYYKSRILEYLKENIKGY